MIFATAAACSLAAAWKLCCASMICGCAMACARSTISTCCSSSRCRARLCRRCWRMSSLSPPLPPMVMAQKSSSPPAPSCTHSAESDHPQRAHGGNQPAARDAEERKKAAFCASREQAGKGRTHLVDSSVLLLPQLPVLRCILNTKQQQGVSWVVGTDGGGGRSEGFVLSGERRRGPTSAPLERSEESGTVRHSLRTPAGSICGRAALPLPLPCGIGIWRRRLGFWLAAPRAADGGSAGTTAHGRTPAEIRLV